MEFNFKSTNKGRITLYGEQDLFDEIEHIAETHDQSPSFNQVAINLLKLGLEQYKNAIKY